MDDPLPVLEWDQRQLLALAKNSENWRRTVYPFLRYASPRKHSTNHRVRQFSTDRCRHESSICLRRRGPWAGGRRWSWRATSESTPGSASCSGSLSGRPCRNSRAGSRPSGTPPSSRTTCHEDCSCLKLFLEIDSTKLSLLVNVVKLEID